MLVLLMLLQLTGAPPETLRCKAGVTNPPAVYKIGQKIKLKGEYSYAEGSEKLPVGISWTLYQGPAPVVFSSTKVAEPTVTLPVAGKYSLWFFAANKEHIALCKVDVEATSGGVL